MDQAWAADLHSEAAEVAPAYAAAQSATAVAAQPGECEPLSACEPCVDEDLDQTYCSTSGLKQEVRCVASANATGPTYVTMFRSCTDAPNDAFATFCRFELAMVLLFVVSYAFIGIDEVGVQVEVMETVKGVAWQRGGVAGSPARPRRRHRGRPPPPPPL